MEELVLPASLRQRASISPTGEHAWRKDDVEAVLAAARHAGLACVGGQVQFQTLEGTCEAYWLNYDPEPQGADETWLEYVSRSAEETLAGFRKICNETNFANVAREWDVLRDKMDREQYDPVTDLWFVLYFASEPAG
jgi:hypothetical protein